MGSTFNPQILVDKLSKLNGSQQSIETLSHWCIFHMNKAKHVVGTWDRHFHCAPREQRLTFLYLANDILQNSRRKGAEFVAEFWNVLPESLRDVIKNGDAFSRNAALRLISIWEERKVFGSKGQILKEEFDKRQLDGGNRNQKRAGLKLHSTGGNALDKLVSGYEAVYCTQLDEDTIFSKCKNAISFIEKVDKDVEGDIRLGHVNSNISNEIKEQHAILRECIEQLAVVESSRSNLVSLLQEALQEQEAETRSEHADSICRQLPGGNGNGQVLTEQIGNGIPAFQMPQKFATGAGEQPVSVTYTRQVPFAGKSGHTEESPKSAAAAMAAKLAASSSSTQMLTFVLSSLASEGMIDNTIKESTREYPSEKWTKIANGHLYIPQNLHAPAPTTSQELNPNEPPPPPSSPPPLPPMPPPMQSYAVPHYMQTAMPKLHAPYGFNPSQPPPLPPPGYAATGSAMAGASAFTPSSNA